MGPTASVVLIDFIPGALAILANFLVIAYHWEATPAVRRWTNAAFRRAAEVLRSERVDWKSYGLGVGIVLAVAAVVQSHPNPCGFGTDDVGVFVASGRAVWSGGDPFNVVVCGNPVSVPYGGVALLLNAIGSLGGRVGVFGVWEGVAWTLVPLLWFLGGSQRGTILAYVLTSVLFFPLVTEQIDGANNAIVPVAVLGPLLLSRRGWNVAGALSGLLSSAKFPSLFPFIGATSNGGRRRPIAIAASVAVFVASAGITYSAWGSLYIRSVFVGQLTRVSDSLNEFGVLLPNGIVPPEPGLAVAQAIIILAAIFTVVWRKWEALAAACLVLVAIALSTQFLSFSFLIWLLPVALLTHSARRWLYLVALFGALDHMLALSYVAQVSGVWWPSEILAAATTAALLGLAVVLIRENDPKVSREGGAGIQRFAERRRSKGASSGAESTNPSGTLVEAS